MDVAISWSAKAAGRSRNCVLIVHPKMIQTEIQDDPYTLLCEGYGCKKPQIMFVGISAGRLGAQITRVAFTKDASGRIFQRCLGKLGLSRSDEFSIKPQLINCYLTNLVKGRLLTPEGLNRLPTEDEIAYWLPHFISEVKSVKPRKIACLGKIVFEKLYPLYPKQAVYLPHPRVFQSRGALKLGSPAFDLMVRKYREGLKVGSS